MALVEPIVGHLLSQYSQTVLEGLEKIKKNAKADPLFIENFVNHAQGLPALHRCATHSEFAIPVFQTVGSLLQCCERLEGLPSSSILTKTVRSTRVTLLRELCRGEVFQVAKRALSTLSDQSLPLCVAALQFLSEAALHVPRLVLARFNHTVPLHLACFRTSLSYSQRRIRVHRNGFLVNLVTSKYSAADAAAIICTHGFLTTVLEDAAELLQEGTASGMASGKAVLRMFLDYFICSHSISAAAKRQVLLAQRNILRLLVRALDFPPVAVETARVIYHLVSELAESPADYTSTRVESAEDSGMPNYVLFFLLRQLKPKGSPLSARVAVFVLTKAPDLIRPYFCRISAHLADEGNAPRVAASTARIATLNLMTRAFMAPIPFHLSARRATLQLVMAKSSTFYTMSPRDVADEVCPRWVAEFVHSIINGSTNLMTLALAMQLTHAALQRAKAVLAVVYQLQREQLAHRHGGDEAANAANSGGAADGQKLFAGEQEVEDAQCFDAQVLSNLLLALPRREEFWHRMTQQLHPMMLALYKDGNPPLPDTPALAPKVLHDKLKMEFVAQRMMLLMRMYTDVFDLREPWISAVPSSFLPQFDLRTTAPSALIATALRQHNDLLAHWSPLTVSALCSLLVGALTRSVGMVKLHHITMTNPRGGITEWPLLLSLLLWATQQGDRVGAESAEALLWVARLLQWVVHGVTVQFGCDYAEALLWVRSLSEETLPCFLHMLNSLLQRSLSKATDRAAPVEGGTGSALLLAAKAFIARSEAKQRQQSQGSASVAAPKTSARGGPKAKGGSASPPVELWVEDMRANLPAFKAVAGRVEAQWAVRQRCGATLCTAVEQLQKQKQSRGCQQLAYVVGDVAQREDRMLVPLHTQLVVFCRALQASTSLPAAAAELDLTGCGLAGAEEEKELALRESVSTMRDLPLCATAVPKDAAREDGCVLNRLLAVGGPGQWCVMVAVCWGLAARLLRCVGEAVALHPHSDDRPGELWAELAEFAASVLCHLAQGDGQPVVVALQDQPDSRAIGFFTLLLVLLRVLLTAPASLSLSAAEQAGLHDDGTLGALARLVLSTYSGTLSTVDRLRYAALLSLHYYANRDEFLKSKGHAPPRQLFTGALVPCNVTQHRYLISQHRHASFCTPEVDMLSLLLESWSDEDMTHFSLNCPARLHNTLLCSASNPAWDLLRSVFPELVVEGDVAAIDLAQATSARLLDPRYFLPLVHTALSLPDPAPPLPPCALPHTKSAAGAGGGGPYRYLGARCVPFLIRALSFTDGALRRWSAAALSRVVVPGGPRLIILSFARLKMMQLAEKQRRMHPHSGRGKARAMGGGEERHPRGPDSLDPAGRADGAGPALSLPRLPAPFSAFLVLSLDALAQYANPLHHHVVRFFSDPAAAFSAAVPFAEWGACFPLGAISVPLMVQQQEAAHKSTYGASGSGAGGARAVKSTGATMTHALAQEATKQLRQDTPPQLTFFLRIVRHSCHTNGDAMALIQSECLQRCMLLVSLCTSDADLRLSNLEGLAAICGASLSVATQLATEGGMLLWLLSFALQLTKEYGDCARRYEEPLFFSVLALLRQLSEACLCFTTPRAAVARLGIGHVARQLHLLQSHVLASNVTAKQTLEAMEGLVTLWINLPSCHAAGGGGGGKRGRPHESQGETRLKKHYSAEKNAGKGHQGSVGVECVA